MNGEDFYEEFKLALNYLGLKWGEKDKAIVTIDSGRIVFTHKIISAVINLNKKENTNGTEKMVLKKS